jgi:hypothetical protein
LTDGFGEKRPARIVNYGGSMTPRARPFSQAPQAVRSARGRRGHRAFPSTPCAGRTLQADECHPVGLTADVHGSGNVSGTAAARAVFRIHSSPSIVRSFSSIRVRCATMLILLRNANRFGWAGVAVSHFPVRGSHTGLPLSSRNISVSVPFTSCRARITSDVSCFTLEPVTAISSPLLKLMPISSWNGLGHR